MAYDKVVDSAVLEAGLTLVGDSIRAKGGTSAKLEFPNGMKAAVEAIDTRKPEQTKTATPSLSQQTIVPDSGKVLSGVTINPITAALLTSLDPDFKPENIAKDANLFGLVGTHEGGSQIKMGTIYGPGVDGDNTSNTITISGIGFRPSGFILFRDSAHWLYHGGCMFLTSLDLDDAIIAMSNNTIGYAQNLSNPYAFSVTEDSITITANTKGFGSDGYRYYGFTPGYLYHWIVW